MFSLQLCKYKHCLLGHIYSGSQQILLSTPVHEMCVLLQGLLGWNFEKTRFLLAPAPHAMPAGHHVPKVL